MTDREPPKKTKPCPWCVIRGRVVAECMWCYGSGRVAK